MPRTTTRIRPRANNGCLTSPEIVANIRKILHELTEIPLHLLSTVYKAKFGQILCCVEMGYTQGLPGFLRSLGGMIELRHEDGGLCFVSLARNEPHGNLFDITDETKENISTQTRTYEDMLYSKRRQCIEGLFKPTSFLWTNKNCANLLNKADITIEKSAFELALECYQEQVELESLKIHRFLKQYNDGIKLSNINLKINKRLFNIATSLNALTLELPEIFYRKECKGDPNGEALIFDGFTHTIDLVKELDQNDKEALDSKIVSEAINSGVYQKTLLLIKETGVRGLKLNVWQSSIMRNFHENQPIYKYETEKYLSGLDVIQFFLALARNELVELRSPDYSKNDLRAYLPRKPVEYISLKTRHKELLDFDDLSNSTGELTTVKLRGRRARTIAVLLKSTENPIWLPAKPCQTKPCS